MTRPPAGRPADVKQRLTAKRPRRITENDEYAAFLRRVIAAYSRRIAAGDIDALGGMATLAADVENATRQAVAGLRDRHGYSWADIAARLGVTRQAAQQRWGTQESRSSAGHDPEWQPGISDECERRYHDRCPPIVNCECYCHLDAPAEAGEAHYTDGATPPVTAVNGTGTTGSRP